MNSKLAIPAGISLAFFISTAANAQVAVQLPEFRYNTVNTTVSVPDRGTAVLGSISRASEGRTTRGVPGLSNVPGLNRLTRNSGIGREISGGTTTATATIIDNSELDRQVLAEAAARRMARGETGIATSNPSQDQALYLTRNLGTAEYRDEAVESVAPTLTREELALRDAARKRTQLAEAKQYWADGKQAEANGKIGLAKIYYRMALNRTDGEVRRRIEQYLVSLESPQSESVATK
jgi:hypothetical protein